MGECGCGDFAAEWKLPGPNGVLYAIEVYPGCSYCDNPAGVVVYRVRTDDDAFNVAGLPDLPIGVYQREPLFEGQASDPVSGEAFIPITHTGAVLELIAERFGDVTVLEDDGDEVPLRDQIIDYCKQEWSDAVDDGMRLAQERFGAEAVRRGEG